jgi:hypothetical protein
MRAVGRGSQDGETPAGEPHAGGTTMPRYMIERSFPDGLAIPSTPDGAAACLNVVDAIGGHGVTWVHSYVSEDKRSTFCVYDGPSPEAIRAAARDTDLPIDRITRVTVLDPYFHH